jgi:hypothetical protein
VKPTSLTLLILSLFAGTSLVCGETSEPTVPAPPGPPASFTVSPLEREMQRLERGPRVWLPIREQSLATAIEILARQAEMNYLAPAQAEFPEQVSLRANANAWQLLQILQRSYQFEMEFQNGIWTFFRPDPGELVVRTYTLRHHDFARVKITPPTIQNNTAGLGSSGERGSAAAGAAAIAGAFGSNPEVFDVDFDDILQTLQNIITMPISGLAAVIAEETEAANPIALPAAGMPSRRVFSELAPPDGSFVHFNPRSNRIIVGTSRQRHGYVSEYLRALDRPQRQMLIRVLFVEVNRDRSRELGLDAAFLSGRDRVSVTADGERRVNRSLGGSLDGSFGLGRSTETLPLDFSSAPIGGIIRTSDLDVSLRLMQMDGSGEISNRATIVALNNEESQFSTGLQIPIEQTTTTTPIGDGAQTQASVQYISVGLETRLLPRILDDSVPGEEKIRLNLAFTVSSRVDNVTIRGAQFPVLSERVYALPAIINNGETLAIGGLVATELSEDRRGIPGLSRLPGIGGLFGTRDQSRNNRILIAYITPILDPEVGLEALPEIDEDAVRLDSIFNFTKPSHDDSGVLIRRGVRQR